MSYMSEVEEVLAMWGEVGTKASRDRLEAIVNHWLTAPEAPPPEVDAPLEEAKAILAALSREYNRDEMCDYKKLNGLIERGEVFLSDGPITSKAYWACWGGEGKPTSEDQAEYRRYCERAGKRRTEPQGGEVK